MATVPQLDLTTGEIILRQTVTSGGVPIAVAQGTTYEAPADVVTFFPHVCRVQGVLRVQGLLKVGV